MCKRAETLGWICSIALALGILPSLTALSASMPIFAHVGPINFIKLGAPFFLAFLALPENRAKLPSRKFLIGLILAFCVGTLFTWIQVRHCGPERSLGRQWAVFWLSLLAAMTFWALSMRQRAQVVWTWFGVVAASAILELVAPQATNFLMSHFFDPGLVSYVKIPFHPSGPLIGIWDVGSLGKLGALAPWILFAVLSDREKISTQSWFLPGVSLLIVLASGQRGSLVACFAAFAILVVGISWSRRSWKPILAGIGLSLAILSGGVFVFGQDRIVSRIASIVGINRGDEYAHFALEAREARFRLWQTSIEGVSHHPEGNACISESIYKKYDAPVGFPSHNMFLEQIVQRGWLWGLVFLVAWFTSLRRLFRVENKERKFCWIACFVCATTIGMFDHPIWVLNQGIIYATLWLAPFIPRFLSQTEMPISEWVSKKPA